MNKSIQGIFIFIGCTLLEAALETYDYLPGIVLPNSMIINLCISFALIVALIGYYDKYLKLFLLTILVNSYFTQCTIFDMEELYNPHINQTVILMGDYHSKKLSDIDTEQLRSIEKAIRTYHPYILIESYENDPEETELLLQRLPNICKKNQFSYSCIDFRKYMGLLLFYNEQARHEKRALTKDIINDWKQDEKKQKSLLIMQLALADAWDVSIKLIRYQSCLFLSDLCAHSAMIDILESIRWLGGRISAISTILDGLKKDEADTLIEFIVTNTFIDGDKDGFKKNSVFQTIFETCSDIFDIQIITEIYKRKFNRVLFVVVGQKHTHNVGQQLQKLGFYSSNRIISDDSKEWNEFVTKLQFCDETSPIFKDKWSMIDKFFLRCNTLKLEAPSRFLGGFFMGTCLAGAITAYCLAKNIITI